MVRVFALALAVVALLSPSISADPALYIDTGTSVPRVFTISGAAHDSDFVHVWAFPPNADAIFVGESVTTLVDPWRKQTSGGWSVLAQWLPVGSYPIVVYAHDPDTGTFPTQLGHQYTVRECADGPTILPWVFAGPSGPVVLQFNNQCF